jgi:hypothetical protein
MERIYSNKLKLGEKMKIIVLFERSGRVRDAFIKKGHDAISVDIVPSMSDFGRHLQMEISKVSMPYSFLSQFDMIIMFPPCTYFSACNRYLNKRDVSRALHMKRDLELIEYLWNAPVKYIAMENPSTGSLKNYIQISQDIQPYEYGGDYAKATGLWLKNLPLLFPTHIDLVHEKNWVQNTKKKNRIITPYGLADAMAEQWNF